MINTTILIEIQRRLASKVELKPYNLKYNTIAAFDLSFEKDIGVCAGIVFDRDLNIIEERYYSGKVNFPYIPTFLAFREFPLIFKTYKTFTTEVDLLLIDGQGIMHPRKCGIATHLGVIIKKPTIGVGKSYLYGKLIDMKDKDYSYSYVYDNEKNVIGAALISRKGSKPLFISPGNLIDVESSIKIVKNLIRQNRNPYPLLIAHKKANDFKKRYLIT